MPRVDPSTARRLVIHALRSATEPMTRGTMLFTLRYGIPAYKLDAALRELVADGTVGYRTHTYSITTSSGRYSGQFRALGYYLTEPPS